MFIKGDQGFQNNYCVVFPSGIAKGDYLITYRAEFDATYREKKLVIGAYNDLVEVELNMLDPKSFTFERWSSLVDNLRNQVSQKDNYVTPDTFNL